LSELIYEDAARRLAIRRSSRPDQQFVEFLESIVWGSGGVQYTMHHLGDILNRLGDPAFFSLTDAGRLAAVTTLNRKTVVLDGRRYPAWYSYGISVDPAKQRQGYGTLLAEQRLRYGLNRLGDKGLFYGYVEAGNISSIKTNMKAGSRSMGRYHAVLLSRLRPRDDGYCRGLPESKKEHLVRLLSKQYENHNLVDFDDSVDVEQCYIREQGSDIVAGVQCGPPRRLTIRQLPGVSGLLLVKALPHIPLLRRLMPERNFHFLTFGNIYVKSGREAELLKLLEALLARHGLNFGMMYPDRRSPVYQRLAAAGSFGLLDSLIEVPVEVMAYFKGFSPAEIAAIHSRPLFVSMNDPV
jgi:GNAT superfamily N-acetyltransferase